MSKRILIIDIDEEKLKESNPSGVTDIDQAIYEEAGWMEESGISVQRVLTPGSEDLKTALDELV